MRRTIWRGILIVVGLAIVVVGAALLFLPGPGFLMIALGLLILSAEFEWARRPYEKARNKAIQLAEEAASRWWSAVGTILFGCGLIAAGILWGVATELPFSGWATAISLIVSGLIVIGTLVAAFVIGGRKGRKPSEVQDE